jgi:cysteine desulfurase
MEQGAKATLLLFSSTVSDPPNYGNPSSVHWAGRKVKSIIDDSREKIAEAFGIDDAEAILFTSSATESINTALKGFYFQHFQNGKVRFVSTTVEHEATLETLAFLKELGAEVVLLPVSSEGALSLDVLKVQLQSSKVPTLVSMMAANNETGVIFPWEEAAKICKDFGASFHLDAVQAPGKLLGFRLSSAPVDFASFSAHKIGGAKGVGALYVRRGTKIQSLLHGGPQEKKRRAGTLNVAGIASFGAAAEALKNRDLRSTQRLREDLENRVRQEILGIKVIGDSQPRLCNTSYFLFDSVRGEALLMGLDLEGFAVSSGSACNSGSILPSHVLLAMGFDKLAASSAIRVSLGANTTKAELDAFIMALKKVVNRIRSSG